MRGIDKKFTISESELEALIKFVMRESIKRTVEEEAKMRMQEAPSQVKDKDSGTRLYTATEVAGFCKTSATNLIYFLFRCNALPALYVGDEKRKRYLFTKEEAAEVMQIWGNRRNLN